MTVVGILSLLVVVLVWLLCGFWAALLYCLEVAPSVRTRDEYLMVRNFCAELAPLGFASLIGVVLDHAGFLGKIECEQEPKPEPATDPVVERVRSDLHRRSQLGIAKYGQVLAHNPAAHRDKLQHAYEEALDLSNYLAWSIGELDAKGATSLEDQRLAGHRV